MLRCFLVMLPATAVSLTVSEARTGLMTALAPVDRGFRATPAQRRTVDDALRKVIAAGNGEVSMATDLTGDWELLYSDAPDIVGLPRQAGPLATVSRVGQQIDAEAGTIENVIEYLPRDWVKGIGGSTLADDALQQRVLLTYEMEGSKVNLKIAGAAFKPKKILGVNLDAAPSPTLQGVVTLPFGNFEVLFNDGDLRIVKTAQGYWGVNRRMPSDDGWGSR